MQASRRKVEQDAEACSETACKVFSFLKVFVSVMLTSVLFLLSEAQRVKGTARCPTALRRKRRKLIIEGATSRK